VLSRLLGIRPEDRRDTLVAFLTLLGIMTAHALLETARDSLFLSKLPARDLPWAYIAIAIISLGVAAVSRRLQGRIPRRTTLTVSLVVGGMVTASFNFMSAWRSPAKLLALYVWTGLLATVVVVELWLVVAEVLDFGQAKRVFSIVGAGGLAGAVLGATLAGALLLEMRPGALLLASGGIMATTGVLPFFFSPSRPPGRTPRRRKEPPSSWLSLMRGEPYLRRLLWAALASSMLLTGVDFVFKAVASVDLAPDQLGPFFARFYAVIGTVALLVQLFVAPRLLRVLGVNGSLFLLPILLLFGSGGFVLTGGLGAALLMRGADGALRHSLHRTGTEILYVPLPPHVRERFKGFVEAAGQRGGQGLASIMILVAMNQGARPINIGTALIGLAVVWIVATSGIKPHYLELFRQNLREGVLETHVEVPDLDLHSLEALIAALSSHNDHEVMASLDLLSTYGKSNIVPALILYHPSTEVVLHAFALFSGTTRPDVDRLVDRLIAHDDERIRAAALRYSAARTDGRLLETAAKDPSPLVRTTAVVELIRRGAIDEWRGGDVLRDIIDNGSPELRRALAFAARDLPRGRYSWALVRLAFIGEQGLAVEVARSMAAAPDLEYVPTLVRFLATRDCREDARVAILALGEPALGTLESALLDPSLTRHVRRHLPRTIARFGGDAAVSILARRLAVETDEVVETKIVRALGRLRAGDPLLVIDRPVLLDQARRTLERAITLLHWRCTVTDVCNDQPHTKTAVAEMLLALLADKEDAAIDRVFRIFKVLDPSEEFEILFAGLRSADSGRRASGRELLSHVVPEPLRGGILAMLDDGSASTRLRLASRFYDPTGRTRGERTTRTSDSGIGALRGERTLETDSQHVSCLRDMLGDASEAIRGVASYRIAELGMGQLEPELRKLASASDGALAELTDRAMDLFEQRLAEVTNAG
jgi:ATP/ADP translocase/HEAT repeat protein